MNDSQKRFLLGVLLLSAIALPAGLNFFGMAESSVRISLNFAVPCFLLLFAKFLALGWRDLTVKLLKFDGLVVIGAILMHLMFSEYVGETERYSYRVTGEGKPLGLIDDVLAPEPGIWEATARWFGLIIPSILFPIFSIRLMMNEIPGSDTENS